MLSVSDLIDIKYIPSESEISLELLVNFYEEYLCKRIYIFKLRDGQIVKLSFKNATEIFHLSGIDHVYEGIPMDGSRFIKEIKEGNIDLGVVKNVNAAEYRDYEIRIRSMACIDTIIKNCEYLWYPSGKIPGSDIEIKYLLLKGLDEKNLHLGIDTYKENKPYFARTLLITEGNNAGKFIGKADERLKVAKLEILDKSTNELLVRVERELAEKTALIETKKYAEEWFSKELLILLKKHFTESVDNKILDILIQNISMDWMQTISVIDKDLELVWKMKDEEANQKEWLKLFVEVLGEKLINENFVRNMLSVCPKLINDYAVILSGCVYASDKKEWSLACRRYIEQNKPALKSEIEELDSYWAGKIVGEAIRKYNKQELDMDLTKHVGKYISQNTENIIADLLVEKLAEQKEMVLGKLLLLN